jgi:hypothetical protein
MNFLATLENTPLSVWVQTSDYGYYLLLVGHAIGMGVVVGTVIVLCIRTLGFAKDWPFAQFKTLFRFAWAGFALNALTGLALFMANGRNLAQNPPFLIKISFIVLGGLCILFLWRRLARDGVVLADDGRTPSAGARAMACATLSCWLIAIMAGRLIAYTVSY